MTRSRLAKKTKKNQVNSSNSTNLTFMEHFRELQIRLFIVGITFLVLASAAYPFFGKIVDILIAPLGKDQQLIYLTPGGAFSFVIKVCIYVGLVGVLPVAIFHIYRFLMPAIRPARIKAALGFTVASLVLAILGIIFAYVVSLPAALYFLTSFNLYHINPMITIDSYFSFVMTYLLAGALLFQLPLIILIINSITPLTPRKMMKYQGRMLVGSFIVAAVISPTPDALNQTLLASPLVVMYQLGIVLIWMKNHSARRRAKTTKKAALTQSVAVPMAKVAVSPSVIQTPVPRLAAKSVVISQTTLQLAAATSTIPRPHAHLSIDGFRKTPSSPARTRAASRQVSGSTSQTRSLRLMSASMAPRQVVMPRAFDIIRVPRQT